jgi:ankyrin repeat protein
LGALLIFMAACGTPTGLVDAVERGDLAAVQRLLDDGADVNERDERGRTAVTAAALVDRVDIAKVLIDAGADVDLQDSDRNNPLLVTGETGSVAMLREVLRAEPNLGATNRYGGIAIIPASDRGHVDLVRALLETDIDVNHVNNLGWTALLEAVILGDGGEAHTEIVRMLLAGGADASIADREGVTPFEHARERGYREMARMLERAGDDQP